jgi:hypothetical protein
MSLGVIAKICCRKRADTIAMMTGYECQPDPARDPFRKYLNQGEKYLSALKKETGF